MKRLNQIAVLMFFIATMAFTGCGIFGGSNGKKGCGCPNVPRKAVG
jgi:hypothetical protein